jgi:hypothetical protein
MTASGLARHGFHRSPLILALVVLPALSPPAGRAAELAPAAQADLRRAFSMVGASGSEEPALRQERRAHEPSMGFMVGAALAAWVNAAAQLDFDLKNPADAGPPHVSQSGGDPDAMVQDCFDEKLAFDHLEARSRSLGLTPDQVVVAAGALQSGAPAAWRARRSELVGACR